MSSTTTIPRPPLPYRHANPHIKAMDGAVPAVKYQILTCQGQDILVGRMKISTPTNSGHAFILRRFDTGAISLTTMFRAAFPAATEMEEKKETVWVKDNHDLTGNNGSSKDNSLVRLAGTWISPPLAMHLAEAYSMTSIIRAMAEAEPDPEASYRRSGGKGGASTPSKAPVQAATKSLPTPPHAVPAPSPAKRRKESSPAPRQPSLPPPATTYLTTPTRASPRRSARTKSPAVQPMTQPALDPAFTSPKPKRTRKQVAAQLPPSGGSDETAVEEYPHDEGGEYAEAEGVAGQDMHDQDVAEQKELIARLKAQREDAKASAMEDEEATAKRPREETEAPLQFEFAEPENQERALVTNNRAGKYQLAPSQKSLAWGVAAFAFGLTAVSFLPNFM